MPEPTLTAEDEWLAAGDERFTSYPWSRAFLRAWAAAASFPLGLPPAERALLAGFIGADASLSWAWDAAGLRHYGRQRWRREAAAGGASCG